jgi:pimeloyl-ACP methyl ester carboxylesterase
VVGRDFVLIAYWGTGPMTRRKAARLSVLRVAFSCTSRYSADAMLLHPVCVIALIALASAGGQGKSLPSKYEKTVRVEGQSIHVYDRGRGPALVFIHGMFGDWRDWEPILESLSHQHRVIALDLPGFGDSSKPDADYDAAFFLGNLKALLAELKIERATLVGNSFGGIIAMLYALEHPTQVDRLVLVDTGGLHQWTDAQKHVSLQRFTPESLMKLTPAVHELLFRPLFGDAACAACRAYIEKQNAKLARADFPAYAKAISSSVRFALDGYLVPSLTDLHQPVLLIHGERDVVIPLATIREAAREFPKAELRTIAGCGHVPQLECPTAAVQAIEAFTGNHR